MSSHFLLFSADTHTFTLTFIAFCVLVVIWYSNVAPTVVNARCFFLHSFSCSISLCTVWVLHSRLVLYVETRNKVPQDANRMFFMWKRLLMLQWERNQIFGKHGLLLIPFESLLYPFLCTCAFVSFHFVWFCFDRLSNTRQCKIRIK